jgi:pyruvate decarboxylase
MKELLPKLTERLGKLPQNLLTRFSSCTVPPFKSVIPKEEDDLITQDYFWPRVSQFFRKKDVIIAETGTSSFGILDVPLPEGAIFVSQILYGSIGWTVGSTLGAALAAKERDLGRTILFIGDGSL